MTSDDYFFESANNVSFFFEEGAHDKDGRLQQEKALSINKIGHAIHDLDPVFRKWTRSHKLTQLLLDLGLIKPMPVQSMYIFKVTTASALCSASCAVCCCALALIQFFCLVLAVSRTPMNRIRCEFSK